VADAVAALFKSDSWDPNRYPPGLMRVDGVQVDVLVKAETT
jgi:hypothetical protein